MAVRSLGFNFRATLGYVTDGPNQVSVLGSTYPTSKTVGGFTVNVGWDVAPLTADRVTGGDPRLAGGNTVEAGKTKTFRVDLPYSGLWDIRLANGSSAFTRTGAFDILDSDGTTVLATRAAADVAAGSWLDATQVTRVGAAAWVANNASLPITFTGTAAYVRFKGIPLNNEVSHISFTQKTAPQSTITDTLVDAEAGTAVLTVSLDVPAPVGGCSVDYATANGTALAGVDYTARSGSLTFAVGETTKTITVPILP